MFENLSELEPEFLRTLLENRANGYNLSGISFRQKIIKGTFEATQTIPRGVLDRLGELVFEECIFQEKVRLGTLQTTGPIRFKDCRFEAPVRIESTEAVNLEGHMEFHAETEIGVGRRRLLENIIIHSRLLVTLAGLNNIVLRVRKVKSLTNEDDTDIIIIAPKTTVELEEISAHRITLGGGDNYSLTIRNSVFDQLDIPQDGADVIEIEKAVIHELKTKEIGNEGTTLAIKDSTIGQLVVEDATFKKIDAFRTEINNLIFTGILEKDRYLSFSTSTIQELKFENWYNNGILAFRQVTVPSNGKLYFSNSALGKTDFILCQFDLADFYFSNSKLTDIFVAETDFPTSIRGVERENHVQAQLAFGQLRTAFEKQGDTVRALEFQSREIEAHYWSIQSYWRRKIPFLHFTKLNLGLNKLSNKFGRDWGRGALFSLGIGVVCFATLVWTTKEYTLKGAWHWDGRLIVSFFRFMNPLRFFDLEMLFSIKGGPPFVTLSWASYVIDYVGRILVAYGYYQTIQAFRRFGRK